MNENIATFINYLLNERRYSSLTIQAYQRDLTEFEAFLESSGGIVFEQIAYQDVRLYLAFLTEKQLSRTTIARKLSSLRSFFKYAIQQKSCRFLDVITKFITLKSSYKHYCSRHCC